MALNHFRPILFACAFGALGLSAFADKGIPVIPDQTSAYETPERVRVEAAASSAPKGHPRYNVGETTMGALVFSLLFMLIVIPAMYLYFTKVSNRRIPPPE